MTGEIADRRQFIIWLNICKYTTPGYQTLFHPPMILMFLFDKHWPKTRIKREIFINFQSFYSIIIFILINPEVKRKLRGNNVNSKVKAQFQPDPDYCQQGSSVAIKYITTSLKVHPTSSISVWLCFETLPFLVLLLIAMDMGKRTSLSVSLSQL